MKTLIRPIIIALFFSVAVSACEDDPANPVPYAELIAFDIMENFYYEIPGQFNEWHYYLTDRSGRIIADTTPVNGRIIRMQAAFDPDQAYDLTIVSKAFYFDKMNYFIHTIRDIHPGTYQMARPFGILPGQPQFIINHLDKNLTGFSAPIYELAYLPSESSASLKLPLYDIPGNVYTSFRKEDDTETRYLYRQHVDNSSIDTISFFELPILQGLSTCTFPASNLLETSLAGSDDSFPNRNFLIDTENDAMQNNTITYQYPVGIFDKYILRTKFIIGGNTFDVDQVSDVIPSQVDIPDLHYTVDNDHPDHFRMTSSASYDAYHVVFGSVNDDYDFRVLWSITGRAAPTVTFDIPDNQAMFDPNHIISTDNIRLTRSTISKTEGLHGEDEAIQYQICSQAIPENQITRFESVTRYH